MDLLFHLFLIHQGDMDRLSKENFSSIHSTTSEHIQSHRMPKKAKEKL